MKKYLRLAVLASSLGIELPVQAVSLSKIFGSHMVMQQNAEVLIWG